jgi:hypothetical protein
VTPQGEVARIAQNLARNCGYAVFPCRLTHDGKKVPAWPKRLGGSGFKDASTDPDRIEWMWENFPGPLIGVATGEVSRIDLLDIDVKHDAARAWWHGNYHRLPRTATFRSHGGGLHLHLIHGPGLRCSAGPPKLPLGVDVRANGGQLIHWFAAGCECLDHSPPAPWPAWLLAELLPKPTLPPALPLHRRASNPDAAIEGVLRTIERASEGTRNSVLFWGSCRLSERIRAGEISTREAEAWLLAAAGYTGLMEIEARVTIRSGLGRPL